MIQYNRNASGDIDAFNHRIKLLGFAIIILVML